MENQGTLGGIRCREIILVLIFMELSSQIMNQHDFLTIQIDENSLNEQLIIRHVLFPTVISKHPLATNYRKIFFLKKLES
jgi:hypothetical protein